MKYNNYEIDRTKYNLNNIRYFFEEKYPNAIFLYLINGWYKAYNEDAKILSSLLDYKLFNDSYNPELGKICCGFPSDIFNKIRKNLIYRSINFIVIDTKKFTYDLYDFEKENKYFGYAKKVNELKEKTQVIKEAFERKKETSKDTTHNKGCSVQIGDTIIIQNLSTKETEKYTIMPTYYSYVPTDVGKSKYNFGDIIYKKQLESGSDLNNNQILSNSDFAQKLLGLQIYSKVILIDNDLKENIYQVIDIIKKGD